MYSITIAVARANGYAGPMRDMPLSVAKDIYWLRYWSAMKLNIIEQRAPDLALELFDSGVNVGIGRAGVWLQRALNGLNNKQSLYADQSVDGKIGMATLSAFGTLWQQRGPSAETVLRRACDCQQGEFYISLAEKREKDEAFLYGWLLNRVGGA